MSDVPPPPRDHVPTVAPPPAVNPATPLARFGAFLAGVATVAVIWALCFGIGWLIMSGDSSGEEMSFEEFISFVFRALIAAAVSLVPVIIAIVRTIRMWSQSTTPGLKIVRLRVVDVRTGAPASMGQMMARELAGKFGIYLGLMVLLGSLSENERSVSPTLVAMLAVIAVAYPLVAGALVVSTSSRQATWDFLARTTVVKGD